MMIDFECLVEVTMSQQHTPGVSHEIKVPVSRQRYQAFVDSEALHGRYLASTPSRTVVSR